MDEGAQAVAVESLVLESNETSVDIPNEEIEEKSIVGEPQKEGEDVSEENKDDEDNVEKEAKDKEYLI